MEVCIEEKEKRSREKEAKDEEREKKRFIISLLQQGS